MASQTVTAQQVYNQVLSMGGSTIQAQVAAALVSGIESGGQLDDQNPTSTASGIFQFLTSTWLADGGGAYAPRARDANFADQVQVYLNASRGNNFYAWKPDLVLNGGPRSYDGIPIYAPVPGSPVANKIAQLGLAGGAGSAVTIASATSGSYGSAPVGPIGSNYAYIAPGSTATQGFGNLTIGDITINAGPLDPNFASAVTDVIVERNIASASTVTIQIADPLRTILRSEIYTYTDILEMDGLLFALVEITKTGDQIQYIFEAYGVFLLRQQTGSIASATTTNITGFAEQLVRAIPGLGFIGQVDRLAGAPAIAVGRGTTTNPNEDSWTALMRVAATAGWRVFESNNVIHFGSDPFWMTFPSVATLQEFTTNTFNIDFDYDIGQPFGNVTVTGVANLLDYPPGSVVTLVGMGPASAFGGLWLVNDMQRDFFSPEMTMTLQSPISVELFLNPSQADLGITGINASSVA